MVIIFISLISFIVIGLIAGWIAGLIAKGHGMGLLTDIVVGIIGALIGGYIFEWAGLGGGGFIWSLMAAIIGAVILLVIVGLIRGGSSSGV